MEKIKTTTEAALKSLATNATKSQQGQSQTARLSEIWVAALFKKFQVLYLHKWSSALEGIEDYAVHEWSEALGGLTGDQIKNGLANLDDEWPPSAISFRRLCEGKGINGFGLDYVPECYRETKREKLIESDESKAKHKAAYKSGMAGLKDILNK